VSAVAKSLHYSKNTKVYILTDGIKIGGSIDEVRRHADQQRNKDQWLSHDLHAEETAKRNKISTKNWQEDIVPTDLIDCILVSDSGAEIDVTSKPIKDICKMLSDLEFRPDIYFSEKLHTRIVASRLRLHFEDADQDRFYGTVAKSELMSGDKIKNVDDLCFALAEKSVKDELKEGGRDAVEHKKWHALLDCAVEGADRLREPITRFTNRLSEIYAGFQTDSAGISPSPVPPPGKKASATEKARRAGAGAA
jgi:hypothetical protein